MSGGNLDAIPAEAVGLKLYKHDSKDDLIACEGVRFKAGRSGVLTTLMRARIAGHVEVGGTLHDYFADVLDADGSIIECVALDKKSYRILKTKWMRCKIEKPHD